MATEYKTDNNKENSKSDESNVLVRIFTSTIFLIIAFISSNLYLQIIIAVFSKLFKYGVKFRYNHVTSFPVESRYWNVFRITSIYLNAPVVCLLTGAILFFIVLHNNNFSNRFRLFVFWLVVCLVNVFLSHLLFAPMGLRAESVTFYLTFAVVGTWMGFSFAAMAVFAGLSIIATVVWGVFLGKELGSFSQSSRFSPSIKSKILLAVQLYLIPLVLASIPLLILSTAANFQPTIIVILNLWLLGVGIFIRSSSYTAAASLRF